MDSPITHIKLSQTAKEQLVKLKRHTKIDQWNILCRWAFAVSLAEPSMPSPVPIPADSNVEMTWKVFGGESADVYLVALKQRLHEDGLPGDDETVHQQFRLHLHRGIGYLASETIRDIQGLMSRIMPADTSTSATDL
jgi:DNA sulfur modification protein DndE